MVFRKILLCLLCCYAGLAHAQSWHPLGIPGFSDPVVNYMAMAIDGSNTPYLAFADAYDTLGGGVFGGAASVMKYDTGLAAWVNVGASGFSILPGGATETVDNIALAINRNGIPYVAFIGDASEAATVMAYNGSNWYIVGGAYASTGPAAEASIAIDSTGTPYVVYVDGGTDGKLTVRKYSAGSWVTVGSAMFTDSFVFQPTILIGRNDTPFVSFGDDGDSSKMSVMKFNGSNWVFAGARGFSAGMVSGPAMAMDTSGTPYVVYTDWVNASKATVMKLNGGSWENVGTPGFTANYVWYTSIAIGKNGAPCITYQDGDSAKATVMKYSGGSWATVGSPGFSDTIAQYTCIAVDGGDIPYVAYQDPAHDWKTTVMRFIADTTTDTSVTVVQAITNTTSPSLAIFPNPTHNTFKLHISTTQPETTTITITNILGEKVKEFKATTNADTQVMLDAPSGIYFVTAVTNSGTLSGKIELE